LPAEPRLAAASPTFLRSASLARFEVTRRYAHDDHCFGLGSINDVGWCARHVLTIAPTSEFVVDLVV